MTPNNKKNRKSTPPEIFEAWDRYFATRDESAKNKLIKHYQFLVRHIMRPFWYKKPYLLDTEDLVQAGNIGLIQAIERYETGKDAAFETFAQMRVRGAILDEINSLDWTPRNVRKNIRNVLKAEDELGTAGNEVSVENIMEKTGLEANEVKQAQKQFHRTFILPVNQDSMREIETIFGNFDGDTGLGSLLSGGSRDSLDSWIALLSTLEEEEKKVIILRFFYGETMTRTAEILAISPNRVSAIQTKAFEKIKETYNTIKKDEKEIR